MRKGQREKVNRSKDEEVNGLGREKAGKGYPGKGVPRPHARTEMFQITNLNKRKWSWQHIYNWSQCCVINASI